MPAVAPHDASAPIKPRRPSGRVLDQKHHRARVFAADRKPLHHAQEGERDRRRQAERRVARQSPIRKVGIAMAATEKVSAARRPNRSPIWPMSGAADRPHQIADREHAEGRKKLGDRILVREEVAADRSGEVAVDREIVPFEHVADHARGDHPACLRRFHPLPLTKNPC